MAERVVDEFEAVEVEEEDGEQLLRPPGALVLPGALERELEVIEEQRAVRQPRQRVVEGVVQ
jgi:hypothetical protein